jgi:hypothetical protein
MNPMKNEANFTSNISTCTSGTTAPALTIEALETLKQMLPISRPLDYVGVFRRMCVIEPLPEGALPSYEMLNRELSLTEQQHIRENSYSFAPVPFLNFRSINRASESSDLDLYYD